MLNAANAIELNATRTRMKGFILVASGYGRFSSSGGVADAGLSPDRGENRETMGR
jgi:hypothetical protein